MAGDWIKMRAALWTHPRFLSLVAALTMDDERPGMLLYACGEDNLGIGVMPPSNKSVTELSLRCVTAAALRDVTMGALLRVWCAVNSHCKVRDRDAVMCPMAVLDLDEIAGFADFGEALLGVGWVVEEGDNTLVFPNFLEFNEPACLRLQPMTNAERQRKFREQKRRAIKDAPSRVTRVTKSNAREEKRREEKEEEYPPTPQGGGVTAQPASPADAIPGSLDTPEFREAWARWESHRRETKHALKPTTRAAQLKKLAAMGPARAAAALDHSVTQGYQGIFEPAAPRQVRDDNGSDLWRGRVERAMAEASRLADAGPGRASVVPEGGR